jgi:hypothetical protein
LQDFFFGFFASLLPLRLNTLNKKGLDGNPAPFKIQYPMKNQALDSYNASYVAFNMKNIGRAVQIKKKRPG